MFRRTLLLTLAAAAANSAASAQSAGDILRGLARGAGSLSEGDAQGGLKEALTKGAIAAVTRVGRTDGYWGDSIIRIPLPGVLGDLQRAGQALSRLGVANPLQDVQLRINRAAEGAAPAARDLFVNAVRSMTVEDAIGLVRGGETSGTDFLRAKTAEPLAGQFRPAVLRSLEGSGAVRAFERQITRNNLQSVVGNDPRGSLADFATRKALDGLFHYVGEEERSIRRDPVKRTSDLLRRVFGG